MPSVDMPLKELKKYKGINPKPADFDKYWEAALQELESQDLNPQLIPADFKVPHAECFDLYFTGVGGSRIHARYARPANASPDTKHPAILHFHGYTGETPPWSELMSWTSAGYSVFALDSRGQGGLSEDRGGVSGTTWRGQIIRGLSDSPEKLLFRQIFLDTVALARIAFDSPEVDENRVGALGGSQGGALTLACAALEPRIKRAAPRFPFLCDYKRVWELDLGEKAYEELQYFFRKFDPCHEREEEIFTTLGYIDLQFLAPRIKAKVLLATGLMDTICPPSTQFAMYNRIKATKEMIVYPDFGHEDIPDFDDKTYEFMMGL
ncbi:acetylxylan esterase [Oceanispirochaeta crateris]|uniref:Acetylxylan esterase n=1 Tax=Oceanispirochaeta crateris TaxID=2518645 RepID=A0A5C1QKV1_9SPIO|nr:acetylxylan esterase [Oceanispirochaeta crateris]QEN06772.1 acetylxylan esterase [Oceanispirochaeta crateris]